MGRETVTVDDAALIQAFQAGDRESFDELVIRHKDRVFTVCCWFLGDHAEAGDCAQETFIKAYRGLMRFRSESAFSTWLYRIAVNTCKNRLKSSQYRNKKKTLSLDTLQAVHNCPSAEGICDTCPSPLGELENKARRAGIQQAIEALPPEQKSVVVLRDIEGLSYEEIVEITGYGLGTVKSRLARARQALRDILRSVR